MNWLQKLMAHSTPTHPETETEAELGKRLRDAAQHINENYNVTGLCRELPDRAQDLKDASGGRLKK